MTETLNKLQHLLENSSLPKSDEVFDYNALAELEAYAGVKLPQDLVRMLEIMTPYLNVFWEKYFYNAWEEIEGMQEYSDGLFYVVNPWLDIKDIKSYVVNMLEYEKSRVGSEYGFRCSGNQISYQKSWIPIVINGCGDFYFLNLADFTESGGNLPNQFEIGFMDHETAEIEIHHHKSHTYQDWIKDWVDEFEILLPFMEAELKNQESS